MNFKRILTLLIVFIATFAIVTYIIGNYDFKIFFPKTTIFLEKRSYDFGNITAQEGATIYVTYYNSGVKGLKISRVETRCGCTVSEWSNSILQPNKKDSILVKYDAMEDGFFSREIYIFSNSETSPDVLYIRGNVISRKANQ